ncbi:MAG TPA: SDR family oxidoreductase [Trueperaceae bacterium]|nr:SDR family oxidoreductase [Trueperaceae bacterium]
MDETTSSARAAAHPRDLFDLTGKVAVVTGGSGALGSAMARGLAAAGASVAVLARREGAVEAVCDEVRAGGSDALAVSADVLDPAALAAARDAVLARWGRVDVLVNAAGGNRPDATVHGDLSLFDLTPEAFRNVVDLNLTGTLLATQAFVAPMAEAGSGAVVNVSSMAAQKPLTRVVGYAAAKAGVENLTRWLAVHLAVRHGPGLRVNAVAPGFFVGEQNRALLLEPDGTLTERGRRIVDHTPMGRFGVPDDLVGTVVWLASDASRFVTGVVVPVDGGYSAYGGV